MKKTPKRAPTRKEKEPSVVEDPGHGPAEPPWCDRCNAPSVPDPKGIHACARCRTQRLEDLKAQETARQKLKELTGETTT